MPTRKASAVWEGGLRSGAGRVALPGLGVEGSYSFPSRFAEGTGTNPEELLAAAHAGCFSMALASALEREGFPPRRIVTEALVTLDTLEGKRAITRIELRTRAEVPGISPERFRALAEEAKAGCPVSRALMGVPTVLLEAELAS